MKKNLVLVLLLLMVLSSVSGCGKRQPLPEPTVSAARDLLTVSPAGQYPITTARLELTVMAKTERNVENVWTNVFTEEYREKTNVELIWHTVAPKSAAQQLNLTLGIGEELPDLFLNMDITGNQMVTYGMDRKLLVDLNPYLDRYAPNVRKMLEVHPILEKMITAPDGGIYALPSVEESYHTAYPQKAWIYRPWLETLGLPVPTNLEELQHVLVAFRDQDPNGNGLQDEIPMTGAVTGWMTNPLDYLMSPFILSSQTRRLNLDEGGQVTAPYDTPQWREGLIFINHLCEDDLLDPGAFFQDQNQLQQQVMAPENNRVGVVTAGALGAFLSPDHGSWSDWTALPPMAGEDGACVTVYIPLNVKIGAFAVSADCPNPAAAVRWVDYFYSREGTLRATVGIEGKDWIPAAPGKLGLNGIQGSYVQLTPYAQMQNSCWRKMAPFFQPDDLRNRQVDPMENGEQMFYEVTKKLYAPYGKENLWQPLLFPPDQVEELEATLFLLEEYVTDSDLRFILGDWDPENDSAWDDYRRSLEELGLPGVLKACSEAYRNQYLQ